MRARTLSALLVKTLGLFFLVNAVVGLGVLLLNVVAPPSMGSPALLEQYSMLAVIYLLELALAFVFVAHTNLVLGVYFKDLPDESGAGEARGSYATTAVAFLGIWTLAEALPSLLARGAMALYLLDAQRQSAFPDWWMSNGTETLSTVFSSIVGLLLLRFRGKISASLALSPSKSESKGATDEPAS